jgi:hypothetical protein
MAEEKTSCMVTWDGGMDLRCVGDVPSELAFRLCFIPVHPPPLLPAERGVLHSEWGISEGSVRGEEERGTPAPLSTNRLAATTTAVTPASAPFFLLHPDPSTHLESSRTSLLSHRQCFIPISSTTSTTFSNCEQKKNWYSFA